MNWSSYNALFWVSLCDSAGEEGKLPVVVAVVGYRMVYSAPRMRGYPPLLQSIW